METAGLYHRHHKWLPPLDPNLTQANPLHIFVPYFSMNHFNIILSSFHKSDKSAFQ
jgi:hypothetical protein